MACHPNETNLLTRESTISNLINKIPEQETRKSGMTDSKRKKGKNAVKVSSAASHLLLRICSFPLRQTQTNVPINNYLDQSYQDNQPFFTFDQKTLMLKYKNQEKRGMRSWK